jgi:hypothetical protein
VRIPHLDGSGGATVVEIEPGVPGAADFVRATAGPIPSRGQLVTARPPSPARTPTPRRSGRD